MEAVLRKIALKKCEVKKGERKGQKFNVIDFECEVLVDANKGEVKTRKGSMSEDYAKRYFAYCNTTTEEALNKPVDVVLAKRKYENKDGEERTIEFIKFMNLLNEDGSPIIMPKPDAEKIGF